MWKGSQCILDTCPPRAPSRISVSIPENAAFQCSRLRRGTWASIELSLRSTEAIRLPRQRHLGEPKQRSTHEPIRINDLGTHKYCETTFQYYNVFPQDCWLYSLMASRISWPKHHHPLEHKYRARPRLTKKERAGLPWQPCPSWVLAIVSMAHQARLGPSEESDSVAIKSCQIGAQCQCGPYQTCGHLHYATPVSDSQPASNSSKNSLNLSNKTPAEGLHEQEAFQHPTITTISVLTTADRFRQNTPLHPSFIDSPRPTTHTIHASSMSEHSFSQQSHLHRRQRQWQQLERRRMASIWRHIMNHSLGNTQNPMFDRN